MSKTFVVEGEIVGWQRARTNNGRYYTDPRTEAYQKQIGWAAKAAGVQVIDAPVRLLIQAYYPMPKRMPQKHRLEALQRVRRPMVKPDIDNILKTVADALNGIAYKDDCMITDMAVSKFYADEPRIVVVIGEA